ncbi:ubiquitin carboxyl-terminal hydrolase MINDY-1 [Electrophorus electricus]|uniref:Ubiquitin carboxyl-terminal hydrolase n=1 Tax=Electrophorus electricus TaxID=8005 RepID=A0A4W4HQH8_ELEEL|nr:ubiquitin carboxyl-terminal hydrolase MINDY-1 [Electrophorus electricus]XP_026874747.2 ubiquitin carboxyl-terminal hydrolase MINDY-1 [Electrophorus electricus]XP_026874748.2 ubiquitin carboxyl-terminal hydrolase MINDY-1 [Electrophorus electricus]
MSDTVDNKEVCEGGDRSTSKIHGGEKKVQAEGVVDMQESPKRPSQERTAHAEEDSSALPYQQILMSSASSDNSEVSTVCSSPVTSRSLSERDGSEVTNSSSLVSSLPEETPSVSTMNASKGNGVSVDECLTSTVDCEHRSDRTPSQGVDALSTQVAQATAQGPAMPSFYLVKWITWKETKTPIITQSENGPCPLLAIMNILFLRWKAKLPAQTEVVTIEELMAHLGECVLSIKPREKAEGMELNFQQNMNDAMAVLPKLSTGLDVNIHFTGVTDFEYTPECIVFDLLDIPLYHGWLVDPQSPEVVSAVGKLSYNQLVEKIIEYKHSEDSSQVSEGLVAEQFLESTATQLSYHGLCELNTTAREGELSVFFRNNHFSTMIKHKGHLYLLVTDQGFLNEDSVVWESLHNVEGDCNFCDSEFRLCNPAQKSSSSSQPPPQQQQLQINQDYLVAISLQQEQGEAPGPLSDLELARQLQQEEYQQPQQPHASPAQMRRQTGRKRHGEKKDESDCSIL